MRPSHSGRSGCEAGEAIQASSVNGAEANAGRANCSPVAAPTWTSTAVSARAVIVASVACCCCEGSQSLIAR
jgi:hypothetical protein